TGSAIRGGGYVLSDAHEPEAIILATGSEVQLALGAKQKLAGEGVSVRVVSMPCTSIFDRQPPMYKDVVLIPTLPKVAVEAGVSDYWRKYVGLEGAVVGNGDRIQVCAKRNAAELPWKDLKVDAVLECTGLFTSKEKASSHLAAGAKKVVISAPGEKDVDRTIVVGVNDKTLKASDTVI